ncbi:hypothetical protein AAT17_01910 [Nonlabens sp. MIC269]|uniref:hypothetical protein n=1 Tax=Nonlabens sp. MIC269 TaxID=1476901 RepID=UPI000720A663|nr:hypothetical protein [Nonlabens sp. MIC269]ALM20095.1 hypothetical protein AAT17_01910 [Nonlabens sp. MIC269]
MNLKDYNRLDDKLLLINCSYDGIDIKYIIRNHIVYLIRKKQNSGNFEIALNKKIIIRLLKNALKYSLNVFRRKNIWVFSNAERRKKIGDIYYDRVASIVSEENDDVLFIENPVLVDHKSPTKDSVLSDSLFYFFSYLIGFLLFRKNKLQINSKLYELEKYYGVEFDFVPLIKRFIGQYYVMSFFLKFIYKPQLVYLVYPNGYYGYTYAFKQYKIKTIELQHGIIYPSHPSYNSSLKTSSSIFKPDYVFTYGLNDKNCLSHLNYIKREHIIPVGSYSLWKLKHKSNIYKSKYLKKVIEECKIKILFIATTNDSHELYALALELEQLSSDIQVLFLPRHPVPDLVSTKNVQIIDIDKANIFELYVATDAILTMVSTSALEALFLNKPTYIYEKDKDSFFRKNYPNLKSLNYIKSAENLYDTHLNNKFITPSTNEIEGIFSVDVMENFKLAVSRIEY